MLTFIVILLFFAAEYVILSEKSRTGRNAMNTIKHRAENLNNGGSVTVYYRSEEHTSELQSR